MRLVQITALPRNNALSDAARRYAAASLSPHTQRAYRTQWAAWTEFAGLHGHTALPARPELVANWLALRAQAKAGGGRRAGRTGQSSTTLRTAVAALKAAHLAHGEAFDSKHPAIVLVMRGAARLQPDAAHQAAALKRDTLKEILSVPAHDARSRRDAALLSLGYCFALRRSELVGLDLGTLGDGTSVLSLQPTHLEVRLTKSKAGVSHDVFVLPRRGNQTAVRVIETWLRAAKIEAGEPVLRRVLKSGTVSAKRLDAQSVPLIVKRHVRQAFVAKGLPTATAVRLADGYSGHSLRVGFAVSAAEAGADIAAIQHALGHSSTTMAARYAQAADKVKTSPLRLNGAKIAGAAARFTRRLDHPPISAALDTPAKLRRAIAKLAIAQRETAHLDRELKAGRPSAKPAWYRNQKQHWLGWLDGYRAPGAYGRRDWDRSPAYIYNHVRCAPMLLWLAEAAGCPKRDVKRAARDARSKLHEDAKCAAIRAILPWSIGRLLGTTLELTSRKVIGAGGLFELYSSACSICSRSGWILST